MIEEVNSKHNFSSKGDRAVDMCYSIFVGWLVRQMFLIIVVDGIMHFVWAHKGFLHCNGFPNEDVVSGLV